MGLKEVGDSDRASDLLHSAQMAFIAILKKDAKIKDNAYNTSGHVNIALIVESGVLKEYPSYILEKLPWKYITMALVKDIAGAEEKHKDTWGNEKSRKEHHEAYKRMLTSVDKFLFDKEIDSGGLV